MTNVFSHKVKKTENKDVEIKKLHAEIGQFAVDNDFFTRAKAMSPSERRDMIRKESNNMSLTRPCKLFKISRLSIYYTPVGFDQAKTDLMHEIDRIFTKYPFFGRR